MRPTAPRLTHALSPRDHPRRALATRWLAFALALFVLESVGLAQSPTPPPAPPRNQTLGPDAPALTAPAPAPAPTLAPTQPHSTAGPLTTPRTESIALGTPSVGPGPRPDAPAPRPDAPALGLTRTVAALAGVIAVIIALAAAVRAVARRQGTLAAAVGPGGRSPAGVMEVLGRYPLGRGQTLVLLKIDRRIVLLSQSPAGRFGLGASLSPLAEFTDPDEVASLVVKTRDAGSESLAERFTQLLHRFTPQPDRDSWLEYATPRRARVGPEGDSAELLDDARTPIEIVDLTRRPPRPRRVAEPEPTAVARGLGALSAARARGLSAIRAGREGGAGSGGGVAPRPGARA